MSADSLGALRQTLNLLHRSSRRSGPGIPDGPPFLEASETVPDDDHPGQGVCRPVAPQQIVV